MLKILILCAIGISEEIAKIFFAMLIELRVSGNLDVCDCVELSSASFFASAVLVPKASEKIKESAETLALLKTPSSPIFSGGNSG